MKIKGHFFINARGNGFKLIAILELGNAQMVKLTIYFIGRSINSGNIVVVLSDASCEISFTDKRTIVNIDSNSEVKFINTDILELDPHHILKSDAGVTAFLKILIFR